MHAALASRLFARLRAVWCGDLHARETAVRAAALFLCLAVVASLAIAGPPTGTAAAQNGTTIEVAVDGESLADGGERVVYEDPTANVSVDANASIEFIEVRVDGEVRRSYEPANRSFSRSIPLELGVNENAVEVIVSADGASTFATTLTKRTAAPRVEYTSPFTTSVLGGPDDEIDVSTGRVTLAGNLHASAEMESVRIERKHVDETVDDGNQTTRDFYRIDDPGGSFSQELLLGAGENQITARYTDMNGRTNTDSFTLVVNDETGPRVAVSAPEVSYADSAQVRATVRDDTKIDRVELHRNSTDTSRVLLSGTDTGPDPDRLAFTTNASIGLYEGDERNEYRLVATDSAGNTNETTFSVAYDPDPQVTFTNETVNGTAETVRIAGTVSKAQVSRVSVESTETATGERLDIERVYDAGSPTSEVAFDRTLRAASGQTTVTVLVIHDGGSQHTATTTLRPDETDDDSNNKTGSDDATNKSTADGGESVDSGTEGDSNATDDGSNATDDADTPAERPDDGPDGSETGVLPAPLAVGTREAFAGTAVVGSVYLLGHWV